MRSALGAHQPRQSRGSACCRIGTALASHRHNGCGSALDGGVRTLTVTTSTAVTATSSHATETTTMATTDTTKTVTTETAATCVECTTGA